MKKSTLIIFIFVGILMLLSIPSAYVLYFKGAKFSGDPKDWGVLGDYIGGLLNPIIAVFNTIILGYLTYYVAKNSNQENQRIFLLTQKITAYTKVASLASGFEEFKNNMIIHNQLLVNCNEFGLREEAQKQYIKAMESIKSISDFAIVLRYFEINYGHLFLYNFKSDEYQEMQQLMKTYFEQLSSPEGHNIEHGFIPQEVDSARLSDLVELFFNELKMELQITPHNRPAAKQCWVSRLRGFIAAKKHKS